jgi:hypothetical protein
LYNFFKIDLFDEIIKKDLKSGEYVIRIKKKDPLVGHAFRNSGPLVNKIIAVFSLNEDIKNIDFDYKNSTKCTVIIYFRLRGV